MAYTFVNGKIFTSDPLMPYADSMVVENERIKWIGPFSELPAAYGECIDLGGRRVLPGFIDAHMHAEMLAENLSQIPCTPPAVSSIRELQIKLKESAISREAGSWILGWGYDEEKMEEKRMPDRWDLDKACPDQPVMIMRSCVHVCIVNSFALSLAGIGQQINGDPEGGRIDRDERGIPTGVLREEAAISLVRKHLPQRSQEEKAQTLAELSSLLASYGITSVTEMMADGGSYDRFLAGRRKGFKQKAVLYCMWDSLRARPVSPEQTNAGNHLFIAGVKLFADGSITGRTAWVDPPYLDSSENGICIINKEEITAACRYARKHNLQVSTHAMGEMAIRMALDVFAGEYPWIPDSPTFRMEHASLVQPSDLELASSRQIALLPQPVFIFAEIEGYISSIGIERTRKSYPIRSMLDKGIPVCISSDAPATAWSEPYNPFIGIKAAVTRTSWNGTDTGQEQRISLIEAVWLYTRKAAEIARLPSTGCLKSGNFADFIVLDKDIFDVPLTEVDSVKVEMTYINGEKVYHRT
ncbi:amidohydrolase [Peribacillus kribbensis]|uniref:amidohydrolase n=1 Tax=Peribacillus kribbensis TaxID=356658 RepID=UPI000424FCC2|nr:amidohydrolase [Peribacillus kribbensis]